MTARRRTWLDQKRNKRKNGARPIGPKETQVIKTVQPFSYRLRTLALAAFTILGFSAPLDAQVPPHQQQGFTQVVVFVIDAEPMEREAMKNALRKATLPMRAMKVHFYEGKWEFYAHWAVTVTLAPFPGEAPQQNFYYATAFTKPETGWDPLSRAMQSLAKHPCIPPKALADAVDRSMEAVNDFKSMLLGTGTADPAGYQAAATEIAKTLNNHYVLPELQRVGPQAIGNSPIPPELLNPKP